MGAVQLWNGRPLIVGGKVAIDPACCCKGCACSEACLDGYGIRLIDPPDYTVFDDSGSICGIDFIEGTDEQTPHYSHLINYRDDTSPVTYLYIGARLWCSVENGVTTWTLRHRIFWSMGEYPDPPWIEGVAYNSIEATKYFTSGCDENGFPPTGIYSPENFDTFERTWDDDYDDPPEWPWGGVEIFKE